MSQETAFILPTPLSLDLSPKAYCLLVAIASAVHNKKGATHHGPWTKLKEQANLGSKHSYLEARRELIEKGFIESANEHDSKGASTMRTIYGVKLLKPLLRDKRRYRGNIYKKTQNEYSESMADIEDAVSSEVKDDSLQSSFCPRKTQNDAPEIACREPQNGTSESPEDDPDFLPVW